MAKFTPAAPLPDKHHIAAFAEETYSPGMTPLLTYVHDPMCSWRYALLLATLFTSHALAIDITPLGGTQGGGSLRHIASDETLQFKDATTRGVILGWELDHRRELELLYQHQESSLESGSSAIPEGDLLTLESHTLQLGGTVLSEERHRLRGFLSGGIGFTHYTPSIAGAGSETRPSLSLGVGAKWMPTRNIGLRLEARGYGTLFNSNSAIFCSGGCTLAVSGDLLSQYALFAGMIIRLE
jgi:opacity protein-like surface antigen